MKRALIGAGGHAREVMMQMGEQLPCFVEDKYMTKDTLPLSQFNPQEYEVMVAIGCSTDRFDVVQKLPRETKFFTFIDPTALIGKDAKIGEGTFIGANVIVTTNVKIGKHALLNRASQIGHDTVIGDYFSAMPNSVVSGNVTIYDLVYLGTNSSIKEKITIPSLVTIGLNSGVVKHIESSGTYVGVPSKRIKQ
jgi:sugar O-acyltransferase (sialic acid O-acetyltransferase NeuD family)